MWAPWCGPCRAVSPALEQLAQDLAGTVKLVKVNVDEAPKLQQRFTVQAIPTLMVLRDGKVIARQAGAMPLPALRDWVQRALTVLADPSRSERPHTAEVRGCAANGVVGGLRGSEEVPGGGGLLAVPVSPMRRTAARSKAAIMFLMPGQPGRQPPSIVCAGGWPACSTKTCRFTAAAHPQVG